MGYLDPDAEVDVVLHRADSLCERAIAASLGLSIVTVPGLHVEACLDVEAMTIETRAGLPDLSFRWGVLHECGELILRLLGYRESDAELVAEALAAAFVAPRAVYRRAYSYYAGDFGALAEAFETTTTCVALRQGEVLGKPTLVASPRAVRLRGEDFGWPADEGELRRVARQERPGLRRASLGHRRTAVWAEAM